MDPNAYEIKEKDNLAIKSTDYIQVALISLVTLLLLAIGYKRQKDKDEGE